MEDRTIRIDQLFSQLEDLILDSPKVPLTHKIIVDEEKLLDLLDHIKQELPGEFRTAKEILAQRDLLLQEAEREAEILRANAERERQILVSDSEIFRHSQAEAQRLIRETQAEISDQQASADQYADEVLAELEGKIDRALQTIKNGRQFLVVNR